MHVEPEPLGPVDVDQPGGGGGRGGQGGRDRDHERDGDLQAGQSVLCGGLGGEGEGAAATETYQAGRRGGEVV